MSDKYYVIGYPVKHSLSPKIHRELALSFNQDIDYQALEILPENLETVINDLTNDNQVKGLSVTVPFKEKVYKLCDSADYAAKYVQAASNVIFTEDRKMVALNYDGLGIINDIKNNHNIDILDKKVLVIGAGGAAKAVIAALIQESPSKIFIANRTKQKADDIINLFSKDFNIGFEPLENIKDKYDIVINSTSASIDNIMLPINVNNFSKNSFGYDLMYKEKGTVFTKWCDYNNIKSADGKGMLHELSLAIFKKWRNL